MSIIQLLGQSGSVDKFGVLTQSATFHARTKAEAINFLAAREPFGGTPFAGGTFSQDEAAEFIIEAKYEGFPGDGGPTDKAEADFSFDGSMEKERIETHPNFLTLRAKFGWNEEDRMFPEMAPESAEDDGLTGENGASDPQRSPVAAVDSWLVLGGEYTVSYVSRFIPSGIFLGVGTIVKNPPGLRSFRLNLGKRKFLKLSPRVSRKGNAIQITLRYQMSGTSGISEEIYGAGQLDVETENDADIPFEPNWNSPPM